MNMRSPWVISLIVVGVVSRVAPLADQGGRLLRQFPTEDGYLMLTIARNIALGRGMSIADGTIPSNGTQPLATFLYALGFSTVGGDRDAGVLFAHLLQLAIAVAGACTLYRLGRRVLPSQGTAAFAAALWFAGPLTVVHTMNGLETGLYSFMVLVTVLYLLHLVGAQAPESASLGRWAGLGVLLGVSFWARNDAVLLCASIGVAHLSGVLPRAAPLGRRVQELSVAALVTILVAIPWLLNNLLGFGHLMPISGQAESMRVEFAQNLAVVPRKIIEYATLVLPIPASLEETVIVQIGATVAAIGGTVGVAVFGLRWSGDRRVVWVTAGLYMIALAAFYGLSFGAGHFMSRYLFPASPFLALLTVGTVRTLRERAKARLPRPALMVVPAAVLALAVGLNARLYVLGDEHAHFQVVRWVERHVPDDVWVGAIQTGTLGFFHDRTVNLDGKVNPEALRARREGRIPEYVVDREIQYLADWHGIADWRDLPALEPHFELIVDDRERNLAVLRRRGAPLKKPEGVLSSSEPAS